MRNRRPPLLRLLALAALVIAPASALAAAPGAAAELRIDGAALGLVWTLPFAGLLLSMAALPLATPSLWHHHYGKIAAFWAACTILPLLALFGGGIALHALLHAALREFLPFVILLFALYTITGGIRVDGRLTGTPAGNTTVLGIGTLLASLMGTTGASMLLIRPLLRANIGRRYKTHVFVFFIFLVSNIGGALSPLGDPPLFLGFLNGVHFFWPTTRLLLPTLLTAGLLLTSFFLLDRMLYRREAPLRSVDLSTAGARPAVARGPRLRIEGGVNFLLLAGVLAAILLSGVAHVPGGITLFHVELPFVGLMRDAAMLGLALLSLKLTSRERRDHNGFSWAPIGEVAKIFAAIFVTIIPPLAILRAGDLGALSWLVSLLVDDGQPVSAAFFWLAGSLSSFLDNAPTYLIFFHAAGGNAETLMGPLASTLTAISAGAVYMGANTYIGNAPNFMVKSIVEQQGVRMPSFFGYMAWSCAVLLPVFVLLTYAFFGQP
jgi:Na+/H+ antiporter NhaD/arsenite permease-like protein